MANFYKKQRKDIIFYWTLMINPRVENGVSMIRIEKATKEYSHYQMNLKLTLTMIYSQNR